MGYIILLPAVQAYFAWAKTLFVFVLNIVGAAIFDFMTVEDWGE